MLGDRVLRTATNDQGVPPGKKSVSRISQNRPGTGIGQLRLRLRLPSQLQPYPLFIIGRVKLSTITDMQDRRPHWRLHLRLAGSGGRLYLRFMIDIATHPIRHLASEDPAIHPYRHT